MAEPKYASTSVAAPVSIFPHVTKRGRKLCTIENTKALMNYYGFELWWDESLKVIKYCIAGEKIYGDLCISASNYFRVSLISTCNLNELPFKKKHVSFILEVSVKEELNAEFRNWQKQKIKRGLLYVR